MNKKFHFLDDGGEMGRLMREKDWSLTPLGEPDGWSQSLRTTVNIILNSPFPMFLFWGKTLKSFYNDAYRPILGNDGKHPKILGLNGKQAWAEIWEEIEPMLKVVTDKGESIWRENLLIPIYRNGRIEDVYWTFSYSPVKNEDGGVSGVLVVVTDTTEAVLSQRRLKESERRFRELANLSPVWIWITDKDINVEYANRALLDYIGFQKEEERRIILLKDSQDNITDKNGVNIIQILGIGLSIFGFIISIFLFGISYYKEYKSNFHKREAIRLELKERKHKLQMRKKSQIAANKREKEKLKCRTIIQSAMENNCPPSAKNIPKRTRSKIISCNNEFDDLERECYDSIQEYEGKLSHDIKTKQEIAEAGHQRMLKLIQDSTVSQSPYSDLIHSPASMSTPYSSTPGHYTTPGTTPGHYTTPGTTPGHHTTPGTASQQVQRGLF